MSDDINTRIRNDEFKTSLPYPTKPKEPALLRKAVKDLTDAEIITIPAVRAKYEAEKAEYTVERDAYYKDSNDREAAFVAALHEYHGMTGHPKADLLFSKAYDLGHSSGQEEVANYYDDLVELVK